MIDGVITAKGARELMEGTYEMSLEEKVEWAIYDTALTNYHIVAVSFHEEDHNQEEVEKVKYDLEKRGFSHISMDYFTDADNTDNVRCLRFRF
jgi:hypothetical protein